MLIYVENLKSKDFIKNFYNIFLTLALNVGLQTNHTGPVTGGFGGLWKLSTILNNIELLVLIPQRKTFQLFTGS